MGFEATQTLWPLKLRHLITLYLHPSMRYALSCTRGWSKHLTQRTKLRKAARGQTRRVEDRSLTWHWQLYWYFYKWWVTLTGFGLVVRPKWSRSNSSFSSHDPLLSPLDEVATLSSLTCPLITCTGSRFIFTIENLPLSLLQTYSHFSAFDKGTILLLLLNKISRHSL